VTATACGGWRRVESWAAPAAAPPPSVDGQAATRCKAPVRQSVISYVTCQSVGNATRLKVHLVEVALVERLVGHRAPGPSRLCHRTRHVYKINLPFHHVCPSSEGGAGHDGLLPGHSLRARERSR
jgi:hypothetical protein